MDYLINKLPSSLILEILKTLDIKSLLQLSICNKNIRSLVMFEKKSSFLWRSAIYLYDEWKSYELNVPSILRDQIESFHGYYKIAMALHSSLCIDCSNHTSGFNILVCARVCSRCWILENQNRLCSMTFAKTHFLLTNKMILQNLFVLSVNDSTKKLVLVNKAKDLSHEKFGGSDGLAAEKTSRANRVKVNWEKRVIVAESKNERVPKAPDAIHREEIRNDPSLGDYLSKNPCQNLLSTAEKCGYYKDSICLSTTTLLRIKPFAIVTDRPEGDVRLQYPTEKMYSNIALALNRSSRNDCSAIIIDCMCDLKEMIQDVDRGSCECLETHPVR